MIVAQLWSTGYYPGYSGVYKRMYSPDPLLHIPSGAWDVLERIMRYSEAAGLEDIRGHSPDV